MNISMSRHALRHRAAVAIGTVATLGLALSVTAGPTSADEAAVDLGTAKSYAVLGGQSVSNTGPTIVNRDLGTSPGTSITGFPPGIITGDSQIHPADAHALQAQTDVTTAYNVAAGRSPDQDLTGQDLGGLTLTPGVYQNTSSMQLTGELTLDALGDPNAEFIFQAGSTLVTASTSSIKLVGAADPCKVFWQVGSSASLGTNTNFVGTIMALTSVSLNTNASLQGRAFARNGSVSMDTNLITSPACDSTGDDEGDTTPPEDTTSAPKDTTTPDVLGPNQKVPVPAGHPHTGMGGTAPDQAPVGLLTVGGVALAATAVVTVRTLKKH